MRSICMAVTAMMFLAACAQAVPLPPKSIPDTEPEVTLQIVTLLALLGEGRLPDEQLTDNARAALSQGQRQEMGAAVRACGLPMKLELLERKTKGEDRQYLYRALCHQDPLLVAIDFNKGAKINRLSIVTEARDR